MANPDLMLMYTEYNKKIERFCKWAYIAAIHVSLGVGNGSLMIAGYVNYYILDLQDESFMLTSPITYVVNCFGDAHVLPNIKTLSLCLPLIGCHSIGKRHLVI